MPILNQHDPHMQNPSLFWGDKKPQKKQHWEHTAPPSHSTTHFKCSLASFYTQYAPIEQVGFGGEKYERSSTGGKQCGEEGKDVLYANFTIIVCCTRRHSWPILRRRRRYTIGKLKCRTGRGQLSTPPSLAHHPHSRKLDISRFRNILLNRCAFWPPLMKIN